jgi:hypothetical protein
MGWMELSERQRKFIEGGMKWKRLGCVGVRLVRMRYAAIGDNDRESWFILVS